ncbi:MAG: hypothetical protein CMP09_02105 [Yangia sp.]|nr:hypothetical protein [Salipiger sp.]
MHLNVETEEELDFRLGESVAQWRAKSSKATQACSGMTLRQSTPVWRVSLGIWASCSGGPIVFGATSSGSLGGVFGCALAAGAVARTPSLSGHQHPSRAGGVPSGYPASPDPARSGRSEPCPPAATGRAMARKLSAGVRRRR